MTELEKRAKEIFQYYIVVNNWPPTRIPDSLVKDVESVMRKIAEDCAEIGYMDSTDCGNRIADKIKKEFGLK